MSIISILTAEEVESFDRPPKLSVEIRDEIFFERISIGYEIPRKDLLAIYSLLEGYFLLTGRFYNPSKFGIEDVDYVCKKLAVKRELKLKNIPRSTLSKYRSEIYSKYGITEFDSKDSLFTGELKRLLLTSLKPKDILYELVGILRSAKMVVPSYYVLSRSISSAINQFEDQLTMRLDRMLSTKQKEKLDHMLIAAKDPNKEISPSNPYLLTTIKEPEQSIAPRKIKASVNEFMIIQDLYQNFSSQLSRLELSDRLINYYAKWLIKSKHVQFLALNNPNRKYLYLLSFISYQYRIRQDYFVDTLIKCTNEFQSEVKNKISKDFLTNTPVKLEHARNIVNLVKSYSDQVKSVRHIVYSQDKNSDDKIIRIKQMFNELDSDSNNESLQLKRLEEQAAELEQSLAKDFKDKLIINRNVSGHRPLMNRVFDIINILDFNPETSEALIINGIDYFRNRTPKYKNEQRPTDLFSKGKLKLLRKVDQDSYSRLYDVLFSIEVAEQISSGSLNLVNSERYRSIEEYLIPAEEWKKSKDEYIQDSELSIESNFDDFSSRLKIELNEKYEIANENLETNAYLSIGGNGKFKVITPKKEIDAQEGILSLLESEELIPLRRVLEIANESSNFLEAFEHFKIKDTRKERYENELFFAAIMALGCNLGIRRMAKVSQGITFDKLSGIVNWYFNKENIDKASSIVNSLIEKLAVPEMYRRISNEFHTSSDGQKFNVIVPSLISSYSPKYHGTGKGVSAYSFIDDLSRLYHNLVLDSKDREATYVLDGLLGGEVQSAKHSTDTHGYTEIVFGLINGLGVFFTPRIKNLKDQLIYTFKSKSKKFYSEKGYQVLPSARTYINETLMSDKWDDIIRLFVSLRRKVSTPSQIVKRLVIF